MDQGGFQPPWVDRLRKTIVVVGEINESGRFSQAACVNSQFNPAIEDS